MGALMNLVPLPYRLVAMALLAVALVGFGWVKGAAHVQDEWDVANAEQERFVAGVRVRQAQATVQVITKFVDRVQVVRQQGADIIREVPVYVSSEAPDLPGGFRLFHDAAARGGFSATTGTLDARPVAAQTVARTVAENYTSCRLNAEQLTSLQEWVVEMRKAAEPGPSE